MKMAFCRFLIAGWFAAGAVRAATADEAVPADKVPSTKDLGNIRQEVETLRGKKFLQEVPAYTISEKALRALVDRQIEKDYPGQKLDDYEELLGWLDAVPPHTDLKAVYGDYVADQVAGMYDSDTKEMLIPSFGSTKTNVAKKAAEKKLEEMSAFTDAIVFAHEYTHALEDQYWPIDDPKDKDDQASTDRGAAHSFLVEGSATRIMIEDIPSQVDRGSGGGYIFLWNALHSGLGEGVLNYVLSEVWKSSEVEVKGVPETLARTEAMPYSYGYSFCSAVMRKWGLDGLDYVYDHPPVSTEQVIHPEKAWEWRDFPVRISLSEVLPGGWKQLSGDSVGEAGMAVLFGCQLKNLNRGSRIACGWDGDRAVIYEGPEGHRLLVWASSWDCAWTAERFASACVKERKAIHQAEVTKKDGGRVEWKRPDGRSGMVLRSGKRVILIETDKAEALGDAAVWARAAILAAPSHPSPGLEGGKEETREPALTFCEPPEDAARAAENSRFLGCNPFFTWRRDGDYVVTESVCGILTRHEENLVGSYYRILWGIIGESSQTASFNKLEMGWGLFASHESEVRRGTTKTSLLPWGLLYSHFSARAPWSPAEHVARSSVLWGAGGRRTTDQHGRHDLRVLPGGLLFHRVSGPRGNSVHILGTGVSRSEARTRYYLLGFPVWTSRPG